MTERKISVSLEGRMDSLSRTLQQAESETGRHTSAMASSFARVDSGILSVGRSLGVLATSAAAYALWNVKEAANQADAAATGLAVTARYAGAEISAVNQAAKALTGDGLMTLTEASKGLQNLLSRGFSLDEAVRLMNGFKDSAAYGRQASLGFGEAVVTATEGLKNENSILVDNAGVTKNVSQMWKEYAAEHGTTADKLTQSQKRHAELNGILRETEGQLGNAARMAEGFAGAEAKSAKEANELKITLGTALQPAMQAVLTILTPVVGGLRDMVYWVETLGARAGGLYDKMKIRLEGKFSLPKEGEAMGFRERNAQIAARLAEVDKNVDATIADIVKRSQGGGTPDIGADTGKRRQDVTTPAKTEKSKAIRIVDGSGMSILETVRREKEQIAREVAEFDQWMTQQDALGQPDQVNPYGKMTDEQQAAFDQRATQSSWAARNAASEREANAFASRSGLTGESPEVARINQEMAAMEQAWAMQTDSYQVYEQRMVQISKWGADQRTAVEQRHNEVVGNLQRSAYQNGVTFIQMFAGKSKAAALIALALQKGLAIGETWVSTKAAELRAMAELGPIAGPPVAAAIETWGLTNMALIAATGIAEGAMSGGMGGGTNSTGGGTAASPVVTQPQYGTSTGSALNITVQIEGNVISDDRWIEERLAPTIRDLATNRNVSFGFQTV